MRVLSPDACGESTPHESTPSEFYCHGETNDPVYAVYIYMYIQHIHIQHDFFFLFLEFLNFAILILI